jgi:O-antigen/teichoic acid export membrane protein
VHLLNSDDGSIALRGEPAGLPTQKSLKSRTLQGVAWTLAGDGGNHIIRFISNLILARLLVPAQFGVMEIVGIVQIGLAMFSDVGIQPAVVQHKRGDDQAFLDTAWSTQAVRGTLLWLGACAMAWPAARYANEPLLLQLLPVVGLSSVFEGFLSTKVFTCDRHLSLGRLTALNLGCASLGLAAKVSWAMVSPTVWALVVGGFAQTIPRVLLSHWVLPGPVNRFRWEREAVRELFKFGRWVFLSTVLTFFALQLDKIVFVKMIPLALFGVYGIGSRLARLPLEMLQKITSSVAFPALSRVRDRAGNLESAYARIRAPLLAGSGALFGFLILAGPLVTRLLYPALYQDAGWIIQLVGGAFWFQAVQASNQPVLLAFGQPKWLAIGNLLKIAALAVVLPLAYYRWGFPGALAGMAAVEIPKYLFEASRVRALGLKGWGIELGLTAAVAACAGVALGMRFWTPLDGAWVRMAVSGACFGAIWIPLLLWARRVAVSESGTRNPGPPGGAS